MTSWQNAQSTVRFKENANAKITQHEHKCQACETCTEMSVRCGAHKRAYTGRDSITIGAILPWIENAFSVFESVTIFCFAWRACFTTWSCKFGRGHDLWCMKEKLYPILHLWADQQVYIIIMQESIYCLWHKLLTRRPQWDNFPLELHARNNVTFQCHFGVTFNRHFHTRWRETLVRVKSSGAASGLHLCGDVFENKL